MLTNKITRAQSITIQPQLPCDFSINFSYQEEVPTSDPSRIIRDFVESFLDLSRFPSLTSWNSTQFPAYQLLETSLLAMTVFGFSSLRELEDLSRYDMRFRFLLNGVYPSHQTYHRFFNSALKPCMEQIFIELNHYIELHDSVDTDTLFLDGTKLEANANKMTFVWMKSTRKYQTSARKKMMELLKQFKKWLTAHGYGERSAAISILQEPDMDHLMTLDQVFIDTAEDEKIVYVAGRGHRKSELQRMHDQFRELSVKLQKYEAYTETAGGRNSFSKTDTDATFMHMKYDYYNHTGVFKPGYNVQAGVSDGYIRILQVTSSPSDSKDFIPTVERYRQKYGVYPQRVPADAGYGSYDNYCYCEEHGIELMMKYNLQEKESHIRKADRFKSYAFGKQEDGTPVCPAGHPMKLEKVTQSNKGLYPRTNHLYRSEHCQGCPLCRECTRSRKGRTMNICHDLERQKGIVRENMATERGQELMIQRSIQSEGTFGQLKEDYSYTRLRRRGKDGVEFELWMVAAGHNIRHYCNRKSQMKERSSHLN